MERKWNVLLVLAISAIFFIVWLMGYMQTGKLF
jgi:hypothetical protein